MRLDQLLVARGLAETRQKAQGLIMAGCVTVGGRTVTKPGFPVAADAPVEVRGQPHPYVSRGGVKLAHALDVFGLSVDGLVCMDVGASTGGFTDCLLQRGARRVYAVDVGYGQLHWRLRQDERVVVMERTNARYLTPADVPEPMDFFTVDVSFISLRVVLPALRALARPGARGVALVKPQFEAGRDQVGKGGVVRDPRVHRQVLLGLIGWMPGAGFEPMGVTYSPIRGPKGNAEFFVAFRIDAGAGEPGAAPAGTEQSGGKPLAAGEPEGAPAAAGGLGAPAGGGPGSPAGPDWEEQVDAAVTAAEAVE